MVKECIKILCVWWVLLNVASKLSKILCLRNIAAWNKDDTEVPMFDENKNWLIAGLGS